MADLNSSICISSVASTIMKLSGVEITGNIEKANKIIEALSEKKLKGKAVDRVVIYNPDAVALWLYQKYTNMFTDAVLCSDIALPMLSVMPSVTPVCFASMYTGAMPDIHGIKKYEKPVLQINTVFDSFIKEGKKVAIVSTDGDSISKIFLERNMDYFIYDTPEEVNEKALKIIDEDEYDLIIIYNGNYDGTMHKFGPESKESLDVLAKNVSFYNELVKKINETWKTHDVLYGFCPDHGCHEVKNSCGAHGLDMEEDMNVIHFYGIKTAEN